MSKYIDADRLIETLNKEKVPFNDDVNYFILNAPAADVQEVQHGRWIKKYRGNFVCSVCGVWFRTTDEYGNIIDGEMRAKYCEDCGAKMDETTE